MNDDHFPYDDAATPEQSGYPAQPGWYDASGSPDHATGQFPLVDPTTGQFANLGDPTSGGHTSDGYGYANGYEAGAPAGYDTAGGVDGISHDTGNLPAVYDPAVAAAYEPSTGSVPLVQSDASLDDTGEIGPPIGAIVPDADPNVRPAGVHKHDPPGTLPPPPPGIAAAIVADLPKTRTAALRSGFWWPGDRPVGVLFLHEFASTPEGVVQLSDVLHAEGIWAVAPVLPGHDDLSDPQQLADATIDDLVACADEWFSALSAHVPTILVVGCGLGGSLALATAKRHADVVTGLVTIGAPARSFARRDWRVKLLAPIARMAPGPGPDIKNVDAAEALFDLVPPAAYRTMVRLEALGMASASDVLAPTVLFHGRDDHVVARRDASELYAELGAASKELVWLERSFHRGWIDHDAPLIAERLVRFADALEDRVRALHAWGGARR